MITAADIQTIRNADPGAVLPGIDTMTGNPYATSSLLDVTKITQNNRAPYYYSPSTNFVYVTQAGAVLSGINFGSATVVIQANNVTIKDCTFTGTTSFWAIDDTASGATVENCTFTGSKSPTEKNIWISSYQNITIEDNSFLNSPEDAIAIQQGLITGNYFSGEGWSTAAHGDAIYVPATTGAVSITNNFIDDTLNAGQTGISNTSLRITDEGGNNNDGVTVSGNYLIGAGFNFETAVTSNTNYTLSNVSVTNNYFGFATYSQYFPGTQNMATVSGNIAVDYTNPAASTQALAAYVPPTTNVVSGTPGGAGATGTVPTTLLGNGYISAQLGAAGSGETNFVGGFGEQILHGGQGANVLTYLALGDGGDVMSGFDPAKDVIDLSHIDADILTPGVQNFTFMGSAPFNGGAEVRYQLNPTADTTTVQAALAGDITADFSITLYGLLPLTAANFSLTSSQSTAALANGAALTYNQVTTAAGAPTEYAYSNVQGRAYTSYEAFYGSGYENLEADDLNLSSNENKLVLYDPTQTVTRGGGAETLTVGTGSDPLAYHAVETIDATTSGAEQFVFSAGFGKETINGYNASGASPDSIQLAKSAFSYLTAGMTPAEDLAAVMSQATRNASGLTINDSHGDSLTLTGVTPSMVAVNPAMLQFT
ncbi:MAG: right-handed parallel beta-helix repeat-containing protein [Roseiarcus sp.]